MSWVKKFVFLCLVFAVQWSYAYSTEILFKGKSAINYKEVCDGKGERLSESESNYKGQYICKPNFKSYAGAQLITEKNDACDSVIEYDPETGWVIGMYLRYPEHESEYLLEVLSERYGNTENRRENMYVDKSFNFSYSWVADKIGFLFLEKEVAKKNNAIVRRCTTLRIITSKMANSSVILLDKYESNRKKQLKKEANKL